MIAWLVGLGLDGGPPVDIQPSMYSSDMIESESSPQLQEVDHVRTHSTGTSITEMGYYPSLIHNPNYVYKARAIYTYEASDSDPNEISFTRDEVLDIVDTKGKWWQARRSDGTIGIVPSNYLRII
ncbi:hypothetical protein K493DRAFT_84740 [Basidiobolus meristosporus CBS 931.73]|uniref:SH3 domain-containing protein n=1 Tax=Basidiobolus meristosporus CBS 931.73 TaxID=1314790 RepID=A0A1Y1XIU7_9FUNG|nr:hypothetical protein K493DRAFT_84740 [Basidiobolus meristosporus CBS 931.73]|eukprot:ORX85633.1 hypothetical protein K493DRAFT_84740 [Basidiobolus meristosporus CBS 931.73]